MAQELYLSMNSDSPLYCLRTGEVLMSCNPNFINENSALQYFTVIGEEVFIKDEFEHLLKEMKVENSTDINSYVEKLDESYVVLHVDSSEGAMMCTATYILHYPR